VSLGTALLQAANVLIDITTTYSKKVVVRVGKENEILLEYHDMTSPLVAIGGKEVVLRVERGVDVTTLEESLRKLANKIIDITTHLLELGGLTHVSLGASTCDILQLYVAVTCLEDYASHLTRFWSPLLYVVVNKVVQALT